MPYKIHPPYKTHFPLKKVSQPYPIKYTPPYLSMLLHHHNHTLLFTVSKKNKTHSSSSLLLCIKRCQLGNAHLITKHQSFSILKVQPSPQGFTTTPTISYLENTNWSNNIATLSQALNTLGTIKLNSFYIFIDSDHFWKGGCDYF